ncbi:MAG: acylphosphatase [Candidatus Kapabacteria bacterium]|nr:acylphosphatase [Candidatus Kapabacteria bacterium]MDW8011840.1 acylphosphatase [Bacteroidota bacterium]
MALQRAHIRVRGFVQGVGFRYFVLHHARSLGLVGYVRNCPGGEVEAVVEGEAERIEELVRLMRFGPPAARVDAVELEWESPTGEFTVFEIRRGR